MMSSSLLSSVASPPMSCNTGIIYFSSYFGITFNVVSLILNIRGLIVRIINTTITVITIIRCTFPFLSFLLLFKERRLGICLIIRLLHQSNANCMFLIRPPPTSLWKYPLISYYLWIQYYSYFYEVLQIPFGDSIFDLMVDRIFSIIKARIHIHT